jgi:hypothetical protein
MLEVGKTACANPTGTTNAGTVTINGIAFAKAIGTGYLAAMQSNSIDGYYCATNGGMSYAFTFSQQYGRGQAGDTVPDIATAQAAFDSELKALNFAFLK